MGLLRVSKELLLHPLWDILEKWLKVECKATIEIHGKYRDSIVFYVEGEDIPEGHEDFGLQVSMIVPGVLSIQII